MTFLCLSNNQLTGSIPAELGELKALTSGIKLKNNQLTTPAPPNVEEISAPPTAIALNITDKFVVQFNESMNVETVNVNSTNTDPFGTIQVSADDFTTVIQMDAQPTVSTTSERNDTFTFHPEGNVSSNATYVV